MVKFIQRIISLYMRVFCSYESQAKSAGVKIGVNNQIMSHFWSSEPYLISIGNNCQITSGVKMFTHGGAHAIRDKYPNFDCFGKVRIGDYVYIGNNSMILPGVSIGNHVIIAAGSVVTKSCPDGCVIGGNPAKYICSLKEFEDRNIRYNVQTKGLSTIEKQQFLLSISEKYFITKNFII